MSIDVQHAVPDDEAALNTDHQHHPAGGRDAGDADHLPGHHSGDREDGPGSASDLPQYRDGDEAGKYRGLRSTRTRTSTVNNNETPIDRAELRDRLSPR